MLCMVVVKKVSCSDVQGVQLLPGSDSLHWVPVDPERGVSPLLLTQIDRFLGVFEN